MEDIRWQQRFSNYVKALNRLESNIGYIKEQFDHMDLEDVEVYHDIFLTVADIVKQGLIQSFEFTHELAWKVLKDYLAYQGNSEVHGSRDTTRESLKLNLIDQGDVWMDMIQSRNNTSHTYNEQTANEIFISIITVYFPLFKGLGTTLENIRSGEQGSLFNK
nr:nucleotidyltransferase substrate binding protein [Pedobacter sp. ASV2]